MKVLEHPSIPVPKDTAEVVFCSVVTILALLNKNLTSPLLT